MTDTYELPEGYVESAREVHYQDHLAKLRLDHPTRIFIGAQRGPQTRFALMAGRVDILLYGGSAGSGKSYFGLAEPMRHIHHVKYRGVAFRRTTTDLRTGGGLLDESKGLYYPVEGDLNDNRLEWRFPSGAEIALRHLQHAKDVSSLQGSQWQSALIDEATLFTEDMMWGIWSRLRGVIGVKPYMLLTSNPDVDSYLRGWLDYYLDDDGYPIQERSGHIRYFIRNPNDDTLEWGVDPAKLVEWYKTNWPKTKPQDIPNPISFTFIPATLSDNPRMADKDPAYRDKLNAMTKVQRERFLKGNWNARFVSGDYFQEGWCGQRVGEVPYHSQNDYVWGFDFAGTEAVDGKRPDWSCATLLCRCKLDEKIYVVDHQFTQVEPHGLERWIQRVLQSGPATARASIPQDPGQSGKFQADQLIARMAGFAITKSPETGSKAQRMLPFTSQAVNGNVRIVQGDWNGRWIGVLTAYSGAKNDQDDDVDSTSRAFAELAENKPFDISAWTGF